MTESTSQRGAEPSSERPEHADTAPERGDNETSTSTGDSRVDAAVDRLAELDERDLDRHAEIFDDIHRSLGSVLEGTPEDGPAGR